MTGEFLRRLRDAAGIKQEDLAQATGLHNSALSRYEGGYRDIPPDVAALLVATIDRLRTERSDEYDRLRAEGEAA